MFEILRKLLRRRFSILMRAIFGFSALSTFDLGQNFFLKETSQVKAQVQMAPKIMT